MRSRQLARSSGKTSVVRVSHPEADALIARGSARDGPLRRVSGCATALTKHPPSCTDYLPMNSPRTVRNATITAAPLAVLCLLAAMPSMAAPASLSGFWRLVKREAPVPAELTTAGAAAKATLKATGD